MKKALQLWGIRKENSRGGANTLAFLFAVCVAILGFSTPCFSQELSIDQLSFDQVVGNVVGLHDYLQEIDGTDNNLNTTLRNSEEVLIVKSFGFVPLKSDNQNAVTNSLSAGFDGNNSEDVRLIQPPLNYPNPFRQVEGTEIRYSLSGNADIELQIYDMRANLIYKQSYIGSTNGGSEGINYIKFSPDTFTGTSLSAGVYFYFIVTKGRVLGKGKMAVIP